MSSRASAFAALLLAFAGASACASATLDVVQPVPTEVDSTAIAVSDRTRGDLSPEGLDAFTAIVERELRDAGIDVLSAERPGFAVVAGRVVRYDPGLRALRYLQIGFGTGTIETVWTVRRSGSEEVVGACRIEGSVSSGTFGGSIGDVEADIGRALARFLKGGIR
jgi:hypothetical protein